jgi:hypothetical protein
MASKLGKYNLLNILDQVNFGEVHLYSPDDYGIPEVEWFYADNTISYKDAGEEVTIGLINNIVTSHYITAHWDCQIINPDSWEDKFLDYDYIGAPWPWHKEFQVGCGFSLMSVKLAKFLLDNKEEFPHKFPFDEVICREYRPRLELVGFKWADVPLANKFSFERGFNPNSFCFHGFFNWPKIYSKEETMLRFKLANDYIVTKKEYPELLVNIIKAYQ